MLRSMLTVSAVLVTLLAGMVLLIRAQPYDQSRALTLLQTSADCVAPCFLGLTPGQTRLKEIDTQFSQHPWIGAYRMNRGMAWDTGLLVWEWDAPPAAIIDRRRDGEAYIEDSIVRWIRIPTRLTFGEIWLALDAPTSGITQPTALFPPIAFHTANFDRVQVTLALDCPLRRGNLWRELADMVYGNSPFGVSPLLAQDAYQLPASGTCG